MVIGLFWTRRLVTSMNTTLLFSIFWRSLRRRDLVHRHPLYLFPFSQLHLPSALTDFFLRNADCSTLVPKGRFFHFTYYTEDADFESGRFKDRLLTQNPFNSQKVHQRLLKSRCENVRTKHFTLSQNPPLSPCNNLKQPLSECESAPPAVSKQKYKDCARWPVNIAPPRVW